MDEFERDGFVGPLAMLAPEEVRAVRDAVDEVIADLDRHRDRLYEVERAYTERPGEVVCHFLGGFRVHPVLRALVRHPRITETCARLLGVERLRFWHDQVFAKPPRHPGVVPWHQDYSYWTRTAPARHITCNLLLDPSDFNGVETARCRQLCDSLSIGGHSVLPSGDYNKLIGRQILTRPNGNQYRAGGRISAVRR